MISPHKVHIDEVLKTPQFYLLWIVLCFNVTAGIGVLGVAKTMMTEIFGSTLPVNLESNSLAPLGGAQRAVRGTIELHQSFRIFSPLVQFRVESLGRRGHDISVFMRISRIVEGNLKPKCELSHSSSGKTHCCAREEAIKIDEIKSVCQIEDIHLESGQPFLLGPESYTCRDIPNAVRHDALS